MRLALMWPGVEIFRAMGKPKAGRPHKRPVQSAVDADRIARLRQTFDGLHGEAGVLRDASGCAFGGLAADYMQSLVMFAHTAAQTGNYVLADQVVDEIRRGLETLGWRVSSDPESVHPDRMP